jgi:hypothetical protein
MSLFFLDAVQPADLPVVMRQASALAIFSVALGRARPANVSVLRCAAVRWLVGACSLPLLECL